MMKRNGLILTLMLTVFGLTSVNGQNDAAFTGVPVVNGKVVFQQFVPESDGVSVEQQYTRLQQWGRNKSQGNPLLSGIRFDDKGRTATISSGQELDVSTGNGMKVTMRFRLDVSVTNAGYMLVVRDITYQSEQPEGKSVFPKTMSAEQVITDQAVNAAGEERDFRNSTRKATLTFLNQLYNELVAL